MSMVYLSFWGLNFIFLINVFMFKKIFTTVFLSIWFLTVGIVSAKAEIQTSEYFYFYGQGCSHCAVVEAHLEKTKVDKKLDIQAHEIWRNEESRNLFIELLKNINIPVEETGTPFLIIKDSDGKWYYGMGDQPLIKHFDAVKENLDKGIKTLPTIGLNIEKENMQEKDETRAWFIAVLLPAALADSINPCAFAVMLLLLGTILSKSKNKKRTLLAGMLFALAIFVSYYLMGIWILHLLWNVNNLTILKRVVGILWVLVGLANIKDFFWYGKGFVMEVPLARRPKMMKIIQAVVSPIWAFFIGIIVSLFLLPCSSGPYVTILGFLGSKNQELNLLWHFYLLLYNFIFILPMLVITILVSFGFSSVEKLAKMKNKNTKLIHLIVWLLMLGLWIYVIGSMYRRTNI